ncbi:hypothetical protein M3667_08690 [Microbacterium sp. P26]|uniref:hypothetical protein n=1 Tax=Microbacterium TaxID=33882 RepID=UPI00203B2780|nr:hypothetical protein [Microbacterium sp. P26]MCM3501946.1 hypothetical protein [Microbacterium sp. P26]
MSTTEVATDVANCALISLAGGFGAAKVLARRPHAARIVEIASAVVMIGLGYVPSASFFTVAMSCAWVDPDELIRR